MLSPIAPRTQAIKLPIAVTEPWKPVTAIHAAPCKHCPSARNAAMGEVDEESRDIKSWPRAAQIESVFACGWRAGKACKGYCDFIGVTERDLEARTV